MKKLFVTLLFMATLTAADVRAQRTPVPDRDRFRPTAAITGTVQLVDCNASPANVRITVGRQAVQPRPVAGNDFLWSYTISGLSAGIYTVTPSVARGWCGGGAWSPSTRRVTIENSLVAVRDINFEYRGRRTVTRINASLLASLLEAAFRGSQIHLNNYTPRRHADSGRDSWHVPNDSFVRFSAAAGGEERLFTLLETSAGPLRYYVQDMNVSRIIVRPATNAFRVTFFFEGGGGVEIKGHCSNTTSSIDPACAAGSDSTAPDFEVNNGRLDIDLRPIADRGDVTYGPFEITFDASVEGGGAGSIFDTQVKEMIRQKMDEFVRPLIDQPLRRRNVARSLRPVLDRFGVGTVVAVRFEGSDLVIESYPR
ncbi:MAG TPA: hypothetical protein VIG25_15005 [Pyrinomonadaceae bacterium]|jgi:hypothetical protein